LGCNKINLTNAQSFCNATSLRVKVLKFLKIIYDEKFDLSNVV
jgi:hypothetical protein